MRRINRDSRTTILSVTHDINSAAHWCGQVLALKAGRVAYNGGIEGALRSEVLVGLYDTDFHILRHPQLERPVAVLAHQ